MANIIIVHFWVLYNHREYGEMIVYDKLWITMKKKNISQYALINQYHFSAGQLSRLRANANVNTHTLDTLCRILDCDISDIAEFRK